MLFQEYSEKLQDILSEYNWASVRNLSMALKEAWERRSQVFICGNGGSAANAIHLANDLNYGVSKKIGKGLRVNALPANQSIVTCLANDVGYEDIFSHQIAISGNNGDILIVLSGSGNSPNIIRALETAKQLGMKTYGILGYSGGKAKQMVDVPIHFEIDDMQIAEDCQQIVGHMVMRWLYQNCQS